MIKLLTLDIDCFLLNEIKTPKNRVVYFPAPYGVRQIKASITTDSYIISI